MPTDDDDFLLKLLQACADRAPEPLYPARYAKEQSLDRETLDVALDDLRRRGLIQLTDWIKDLGQGRALTEAGKKALAKKNPAMARADSVPRENSVRDRGEVVRGALDETRRPFVSWMLTTVNLLFFLVGAVDAAWHGFPVIDYLQGEDGVHRTTTYVLIDLGALNYRLVLFPDRDFTGSRAQLERLILFFFLHAGVLHLAMNMFFLVMLGPLIESMWGRLRFLAIYLVAGLVSGCVILSLDLLLHRNTLMVGASGPIYGLFAAMLVWLALNREHLSEEFFRTWSRSLTIMVILLVGTNFLPSVSWQGHLGGAIGGVLAALLLHVQRFHPSRVVRILALLCVPVVPLAFFGAVLKQASWW